MNYSISRHTTPDELAHMVEELDVKCTCDQCQPQLYAYGRCAAHHPHVEIHQHPYHTRFHPVPNIIQEKRYEALYLARAAIAYFSRPEIAMTAVQREALGRFRAVCHSRFGCFGNASVQDGYSLGDVLHMVNDLFFFGAVRAEIKWANLRHRRLGVYHIQTQVIEIDSRIVSPGVNAAGLQARKLDVILHEAVHAFLAQLSCSGCPTHESNVHNAGGHARAFQLLAAELIDVTASLLGAPLDSKAFGNFKISFDKAQDSHLPSMHDIETWKWRA